jgi:hypothetical protein
MAAGTETITFKRDDGDRVFSVTQLPPTRAYKLAAKLGKVLGPALPDLFAAVEGGKLGDMDLTALGGGLQKLLANLPESEIDSLIGDLLQGVSIQANARIADLTLSIFNNEFAGHLKESFSLIAFVIKVNFSDFFKGVDGSKS